MPRFPTYERQVGLSGGSTGSFASDSAFTAPARALGGLGDAVAGVGDQFAAVENKIRETQDDTWFSKARAETVLEQDAKERELRTGATGDAGNYTPQVRGTFDEIRKGKVAGAPSQRSARMYEEWATGYDVDVTRRSASFQAESELAKRTSDFADAMNLHAQAILADPSQFDAVHKRAMDDFEGAKQWMTPEQETAVRAKVDHDLKLARAKSLVEFAPEDFLAETGGSNVSGDTAVDVVTDKIIGVESGGNPNAKNPKSSASGLGQFLDSTWVQTVRQHRPDIAAGKSAAQLIALKSDRKLGREMTKAYQKDNAGYLANRGEATTPGNIYLAHFLGPGGAVSTLKADPNTPIVNIVGQDVVNANPFLSGKTAADTIAWSNKKMGGKGINVVGKPEYEGLSVDELLSLQNRADSTIKSNQAVAYSQLKDSFSLGIQTGNGISEDQILGSGLDDGDKASLISQFRTVRKDERGALSFIEGITDKNLRVDPFDSEARKNADNAAKMVKEKFTPEQYQSYTDEVARQTGMVSKDVVNEIRKGLQSTNAQEVAAAAQRASRISSIDPAALGRRDGGSEVQKDATAYDHYVNTVGLSPDDAAQRLMDMKDPEKTKARAALMESKPIKDFIKDIDVADVRDIFDPGAFGFDPALGESPATAAAMVGEYKSILEESIFDSNGDTELGKVLAAERFQRLYGPSPLTMAGGGVVTRLPPEKTYPKASDGTHDYIGAQMKEVMAAEGVEADNVFLQAYEDTEADFRSGKPPRYQIWYEKDGRIEMYNLPFFADPKAAEAAIIDEARQRNQDDIEGTDRGGLDLTRNPWDVLRGGPKTAEERQRERDAAKAREEESKENTIRGRDRGATLDRFLDADPLTGVAE